LDGVIAITPTVIESLLKMTGSITVDGVEFTEQNLFEQLQLEVEFNYSKKGISDLDRKAIIGHLATELMNRIMSMPRSRFAELWDTFVTNVDQKQIQLYVDDPITQSLILAQNWGGEMKEYGNSDYLMVVDANLAALKTDRKMERSIAYNVLGDNGSYYGSAEVTYINHTEQAQKVGLYTRYRTYTRIYLPYGSELVEYSGYLTNDVKVKHGVPTAPEVTEESFTRPDGTVIQYTVVGGFTAIEPRETGKLYIKYKLPQSVAQQINNKTYTVYIQKQSGTHEHGLHFNFDIGQKINNAVASDLTSSIEGNKVSFDTDLQVDREFTIYLK
ncbi:MAG TPA: hypothetical protein VJB65_02925, partial [Patescibacteria group bacterium]|nr:hypothetical protein [Patescibacteria group bacterium]